MDKRAFKDPLQPIQEQYLRIDNAIKTMQSAVTNKYKDSKNALTNQIAKLDSLSPLKTLARGYAITQKDGVIIKSVKQLSAGDKIELKYTDGTVDAVVK